MHRCKWCKRVIADLGKMNGQCECGSRAFVFVREREDEEGKPLAKKRGAENIYSPEQGVFEIDVEALAKGTAVLLDGDGVYHMLLKRKAR